MTDLLTPDQCAEMLGLKTANTLWAWREKGYGPPYIKIGRQVKYSPKDVQDWYEKQRTEPTRPAGKKRQVVLPHKQRVPRNKSLDRFKGKSRKHRRSIEAASGSDGESGNWPTGKTDGDSVQ